MIQKIMQENLLADMKIIDVAAAVTQMPFHGHFL